jgi:mycothione reductase
VGATEQALRDAGVEHLVATHSLSDVAYGWAMRDTGNHFVNVLANPTDGTILGAHIFGEDASILIQPFVQAMTFGLDVVRMAENQYWPHPALTEVIENALLKLSLTPQERKRARGKKK